MLIKAAAVAAGISPTAARRRLKVREAELGSAGQSPHWALIQGSPSPIEHLEPRPRVPRPPQAQTLFPLPGAPRSRLCVHKKRSPRSGLGAMWVPRGRDAHGD